MNNLNIYTFVNELASYLAFLPGIVICLLPMRHQTRLTHYSAKFRVLLFAGLLILFLPAAYIGCRYRLFSNLVRIPLVFIIFCIYHRLLTVHISKSLAIFAYACALMSFMANYAIEFDALLHPDAPPYSFSIVAEIFQFSISTLLVVIMAYPLWAYGSRLIDSLDNSQIWYITVLISWIFLMFNLFFIPHNYQTLYTNKVFRSHVVILVLLFILILLLSVIFYYIVSSLLDMAESRERNRIFEMQEKQYTIQQQYMEDSAKARHDFKQTVYTLQTMSQAKDYEAIDKYLDKYMKALPQNDYVHYCRNNALNALLNHYAIAAVGEKIELNLMIDLPEAQDALAISDVDLCSMIGNILENALYACREIPEGSRYIELSVTTHQQAQFCIVATNSFSGHVKQKDGKYLSTHRSGNGIGLASIASTAERYGGISSFSHDGGEFYTNVMIPM